MTKNITKAQLKRRLHTFTGEDLAGYLISYLERSDLAPDDPVVRLVDLAERQLDPVERIASGKDIREEMKDFIDEINVAWGFHMHFVPGITPEGLVTVTQQATLNPKPGVSVSPTQFLEWNRALALLGKGLLHKVRHCAKPDCRKLFFAHFNHVRYHSDECRLACEYANETYREKRREFMREKRAAAKRRKTAKHKKGE